LKVFCEPLDGYNANYSKYELGLNSIWYKGVYVPLQAFL